MSEDIFVDDVDLLELEKPREKRTIEDQAETDCVRCGDPFKFIRDIDKKDPRRCKKCEREIKFRRRRDRLERIQGLDNI